MLTYHRIGGIIIVSKERNVIQAMVEKMARFYKSIKGTATFEEWGTELISAEVVSRYEFRDRRSEVVSVDAEDIAKEIRKASVWDLELCEALCELADMSEAWEQADGEDFESVLYAAAEKLGVEV